MNSSKPNIFVTSFLIFKEALKGENQDYTKGDISKSVLLLAIPMILEMSMESVFALVDIYFVGHLPNSSYTVQTVGLTESVLSIVYALAIGIAIAATAVVARRVGAKNQEGAKIAATQSIWVALFVSLILSILGYFFASQILGLMGADAETIKMGTPYAQIMFVGCLSIMLLFLINGIFRGAGNAAIAMKSLWLANICNIILCPTLIYGFGPIPSMGLTGAAWATTIGRSIGVMYQLYYLFKANEFFHLHWRNFRLDIPIIRSIIQIASPGSLQFIIGSCSWIFLAKLVAETGHSTASAGFQTALRVVIFFILPAWGMSNAAATLVGQNLGANQPKRAEECVKITAKYNAYFMGVVSLIFLLGASPIISIFTNNPQIKMVAVEALQIIAMGYIFFGVGMVFANAFNGAGDSWTPTIINFCCFWLFQIPLSYLLAKYYEMGPTGVFISIPIAESTIAIVAYVLFKKGKWKLKKV
jgi:putative MATE family efflux protein